MKSVKNSPPGITKESVSDVEGGSSSFMAPTAENMRKFELKNQRGMIGSSLITGAIAEVVHTNKVKSEYNARVNNAD